jgi:uncharacterized phage-like protein YoqJ
MKIAFTGHRPKDLPLNSESWIRVALENAVDVQIRKAKEKGEIVEFFTGMAIGVDQIAAEICIKKRKKGEPVKVHAAIPFKGQQWKWSQQAQRQYNELLSLCDEVHVVCEKSSVVAFHKRNEYMVNNSEKVVAVWTGKETGGTASCIEYAKKRNRPILQINPLTKKVSRLN